MPESASPACRPGLTANAEGVPPLSQNDHLDAAWQYHSGTKHSQLSVRMNPHFLDWANKPLLFKIYPTLEPMRLPGEFRQTGVAALSAISRSVSAHSNAVPDLEAVAQLL